MRIILLVPLLLTYTLTFAQETNKIVRLKGVFKNCADTKIEIMPDGDADEFKDTIHIQKDGSFYYETSEINRPIWVNLTNAKQIQVQCFLAPGYDLSINADVTDGATLFKTITYNGIGATSNKYWEMAYKTENHDTVNWLAKDEKTFTDNLFSRRSEKPFEDSFFSEKNTDPYKADFYRIIKLDIVFSALQRLFVYASFNHYTPKKIDTFLRQNFDNKILNNFSNDSFLLSPSYTTLISWNYLDWQINMDKARDTTLANDPNYYWQKIIHLYKGRTRDFVLYEKLTQKSAGIFTLNEIDSVKKFIQKNIVTASYKNKLLKMLDARNVILVGKDAPLFNLPDTNGNLHSLAEFKGKVVYIDFWGSWCGPCRKELPYMKKAYERYKNRKDIAFVSIAIGDNDHRKERQALIKDMKLDWVQLEDQNDTASNNYKLGWVPLFVIVDKQGKIADINAPWPSNDKALISLLDKQLEKN